jgi:hypothetical protein
MSYMAIDDGDDDDVKILSHSTPPAKRVSQVGSPVVALDLQSWSRSNYDVDTHMEVDNDSDVEEISPQADPETVTLIPEAALDRDVIVIDEDVPEIPNISTQGASKAAALLPQAQNHAASATAGT